MNWTDDFHRSAELSGARVLVVEDEAIIAFDLEATLNDAGAEVIGPSASVEEALDLLKREAASAAVLDVRVGDRSIVPVVRRLQARNVPFLFYSGQADTDSVRREFPEAPFIAKPAPPKLIVSSVLRLLQAQGEAADEAPGRRLNGHTGCDART